MKIWYLAHPVLSDDQYTCEQNLEHVLVVQGILHKAGIFTIIPWFSWVTIYGDVVTGEFRNDMLAMDCSVVKLLKGDIIFTGHKMAEGMEKEFRAAGDVKGLAMNFIGVPDDMLESSARNGVALNEQAIEFRS